MTVDAILKTKGRNVYSIRPEHHVEDAVSLMSAKKVGVANVCDAKGGIVGVISERDIVAGMAQFGKGIIDMPVRNIMTSPVLTCQPTDTAKRALEIMSERNIRHLPVVEGGELVGMLSIRDAVSYRLKQTQMEMGVLRDFAASR